MYIESYTDIIKEGYESRVRGFRDYLYSKAFGLGDNLMPQDIAEAMKNADRSGIFKGITFNGFNSIFGKLLLMIEVYESCGFDFPNKELTRDNVQEYF